MVLRALVFACLLAASPALGHSWYDRDCCSDNDCEPIPSDVVVRQMEDGDYAVGPQRVPKENVRQSHDSDWHWCRPMVPPGQPKMIKCLYVPMAF